MPRPQLMPLYNKKTAENDQLWQNLFESFAEAILIIDPYENQIVSVNPVACKLLQFNYSALLGTKPSELFPDQVPGLIVFSETALANGRAWSNRFHCKTAKGDYIDLEIVANLIEMNDKALLGLTLKDLTIRQTIEAKEEANDYIRRGIIEWKRIEYFFSELERENQLILNAAGEGVYGVNTEGATTFVNPAAEKLLGYQAEELVGKNMHIAVHHHHSDGSIYHDESCPIMRAFRDGKVHHVTDEVFWRKDGSSFPVHYTSTPIMDHGNVVGAVIVFRDVSEQVEAEQKLKRALEEVSALKAKLELENEYLLEEIKLEHNHHEIIGQSDAINHIIRQIDTVAETDANVLIYGESGTGKELIARAIHESSPRKDRPLIRVNCAAIPRDLFESEFFGHIKGAFTGAVRDRIGRFELADQGTLFLDEVGEIPQELQSKLLRVIQEGQFERLGEEKTRNVNVRIIAATNRNLEQAVEQSEFRQDLYFRLNVFPIYSVPLRERPDDIPLLASYFLAQAKQRLNKPDVQLMQSDIEHMINYDWPGNVRELENVIERALILSVNSRLILDLPKFIEKKNILKEPVNDITDHEPITEVQRKQMMQSNIIKALEACKGKVFGKQGAAEMLAMKPTTLDSRIKALGIDKRQFKK